MVTEVNACMLNAKICCCTVYKEAASYIRVLGTGVEQDCVMFSHILGMLLIKKILKYAWIDTNVKIDLRPCFQKSVIKKERLYLLFYEVYPIPYK